MTRREHEITDMNRITEILDKCKIVHLAFIDDGTGGKTAVYFIGADNHQYDGD